jgi:APA family basic amino acid/polyamine antiporter
MTAPAGLRQNIRLIDIVTLGAGTAIGVAMFSIFGPAAQLAGTGMLVALVVAAVPMATFAVIYAFMGSAVPVSGASFEWPSRFVHPFVGFMISWLRILGSTGAMVVLALVLVQHWTRLFDLPLKPTMLAVFVLFYGLNVLGVSVAARAQSILFGLLFLALAIFVAAGVPRIEAANFTPALSLGWDGVLLAVPLLVSLYLGIETAAEVGEEIRDARRSFTRGVALTVCVTILIYASVSAVALGTLGPVELAASTTPLLDVATGHFGAKSGLFIIAAATLAIATSLNALLMIFSRYLFAMGRRGVLPAALARVHPRWGTPHVATTVAFGCCVAGLLLPGNLIFLFLAVNIPTMLKYLGTSLSAWNVARRHPDVYEKAGFRLGRAAVAAWAAAGIVFAVGIIAIGYRADWRPYAVLAGWAVVGVGYWLVRRRLADVAK